MSGEKAGAKAKEQKELSPRYVGRLTDGLSVDRPRIITRQASKTQTR